MSPCHPTRVALPSAPSGFLLHLLGLFQEFQGGRGGCWGLSAPNPSWDPHSQGSGASGGASSQNLFPPGDSVCCKSRAPQDHSRFSLCSQTFSLFALSVSHGHPGPSPLTHGCRCSGGQSRAVLQHNPWDLPSLSTTSQSPSSTFLGISPGSSSTLGHSSRSQEMLPKKPRAPPFPLFCQVGLFPWLQGHSLFPAPSPGWELGFLGCSWNTPGPISRKPLWGPGPFLGCHWRCCCSGGEIPGGISPSV